ncbi:ExbD/TolR family protein [Singulisphaera sp. PoT]|uniref:ExbD/TolR family protein n=1 Tax=Singulisphaera sp. PoT TaxID=3411797 RepID=UPI003BF48F20
MATWDVFHSERLEVVRGLSSDAVRQGLRDGELRDDDLIRPAGTTVPWTRIADFPDLVEPDTEQGPWPATVERVPTSSLAQTEEFEQDPFPPTPPVVPTPPVTPPTPEPTPPPVPPPAPAVPKPPRTPPNLEKATPPAAPVPPEESGDLEPEQDDIESHGIIDDSMEEFASDFHLSSEEFGREDLEDELQFADVDDDDEVIADMKPDEDSSLLAMVVTAPIPDARHPEYVPELGQEFDPHDDDEEAAEFTLARGGPERVEELDLAAMVDVAFQLVLFFLVTATTVMYKSLEVPKPNPDSPAAAAAQGRSRTMDDLKDDYILVEIDPVGTIKIDREPVDSNMNAVVERLRTARATTKRSAMLLSADFATPHRNAVMAYDAANEIGLGIAIARPSSPDSGPRPAATPAAAKKAAAP